MTGSARAEVTMKRNKKTTQVSCFGAASFSIMTFSIIKLSIKCSFVTLSINAIQNNGNQHKGLFVILSINDIQHNDTQHEGLICDTEHK
jgi:hypothetical protein